MKFLKLIGNVFFLFCTVVLTIVFAIALKEKIERPHFKNLNIKEFIIFGVLLFGFIYISYKIVSSYFKKSKI